jgi:hypothetical protein
LVILGGCRDEPLGVRGEGQPLELNDLRPGFHPVLSSPELSEWTAGAPVFLRFHLVDVDVGADVQSIQGELRYDAKVMEPIALEFPEGILGAWNEVEPGTIRYAGVAVDGVGDRAFFELLVEAKRPIQRHHLKMTVEEVVGTLGEETFRDVTPQVAAQEETILTTDLVVPSGR